MAQLHRFAPTTSFYRGLLSAVVLGAVLAVPPARSYAFNGNPPFVEPTVIQSQNGVLEATLSLENGSATINGQVVQGVWTYRIGQGNVPNYPGPTLKVNPGDTIKLHYENNLDDSPPNSGADTPQSLHVHGLHVSPLGNSDNVLLQIFNGQSNDFKIEIPANHPMGLYWYHPHVHGFVDPSIYYGLCGLISIGNPNGGATELQNLPNRLMAVQYQTITDGNLVLNVQNNPPDVQFTVNGLVNPALNVVPGTTEVWNIANISNNGFIQVELNGKNGAPDVPLVLVAQDGNPFMEPVVHPVGQKMLIPTGARRSILVQFPVAGTYELKTYLFNDGFNIWPDRTLATVNCAGPQVPVFVVPDELSPPNNQFRPLNNFHVDLDRPVLFNAAFPANEPPQFLINGGQFPENPVYQPRLNTVEQWEVINVTPFDHPFHIHVNDFQIQSVEAPVEPDQNVTSPTPWYQDIINLPQAQVDMNGNLIKASRVVMRMNPLDFLGTYVYHCHRVDHEDLGMMALVKIIPNMPIYAVSENRGGSSMVRVYNGNTNGLTASINAFGQSFPGGLRTAVADFNRDGFNDVLVVPGPGGPPRMKVFSGATTFKTTLFDQVVHTAGFRGGLNVAGGDINSDGFDDMLVAPASNERSFVKVFSGMDGSQIAEFMPYPAGYKKGVTVACDIINDGGRYSIITGTASGGPPDLKVFQVDWNHVHGMVQPRGVMSTPLPPIVEVAATQAYSPEARVGLNVGTGPIDGQNGGFSSVLVGPGALGGQLPTKTFVLQGGSHHGAPHGHGGGLTKTEVATLFPYPSALKSGVSVSAVNTPFGASLLTTPADSGAPTLKRFAYDGDAGFFNLETAFSPVSPGYRGGIYVSGR